MTTGRKWAATAALFLVLMAGILAGRFLFPRGAPAGPAVSGGAAPGVPEEKTVWTCSMHPQIRMDKPGPCPICGMPLIPAQGSGGSDGVVRLGEGARRIASIEVEEVKRRALHHEIRTVGRIDFAEPRVAHLAARIDGRVERLYADFTGVAVAEGDHLVDLYSPDLVLAQEELLLADRHLAATPEGKGNLRLAAESARDAALQKLLLWGVTQSQIHELRREGQARTVLTIHAPIGGTVIEKPVREGMYVKMGDPLYTIADLSTVWLYADVYEYELPWIALGQEAAVEAEGAPGERFTGTLAFIDPVVSDATRTVRVRVNLANPGGRLKPGMFAKVVLGARLGPDGTRAASALAGKYACPMHPEVFADEPGDCRICGMALVRRPDPVRTQEDTAPPRYVCPMACQEPSPQPGTCAVCAMTLVEEPAQDPDDPQLVAVPASAVLDTGVRQVVYQELEPGAYTAREVHLGPRAGDFYPVLWGIAEGARVVTRGNFLIDSQSQIEGEPSLLFPGGAGGKRTDGAGGPSGHGGHEGHGGH